MPSPKLLGGRGRLATDLAAGASVGSGSLRAKNNSIVAVSGVTA
jgi:hypothetical protein